MLKEFSGGKKFKMYTFNMSDPFLLCILYVNYIIKSYYNFLNTVFIQYQYQLPG